MAGVVRTITWRHVGCAADLDLVVLLSAVQHLLRAHGRSDLPDREDRTGAIKAPWSNHHLWKLIGAAKVCAPGLISFGLNGLLPLDLVGPRHQRRRA
jgi:hypothetical protein